MKIKVYNGTKEDRHLCPTCDHAQIISGQRDHEQVTLCMFAAAFTEGSPPFEIKFRVADCNKYKEKDNSDSLYQQMQQSATYLHKLASGRVVGLHLGQLQDGMFLQALRKADGVKERNYEEEAKAMIKTAAAKGE